MNFKNIDLKIVEFKSLNFKTQNITKPSTILFPTCNSEFHNLITPVYYQTCLSTISSAPPEKPRLSDRYQAAKDAGFSAVECGIPYDYPIQELAIARSKAGLQHVLLNTPCGDQNRHELGLAALPAHEHEFKDSLELAIKYAKGLECKRIHIYAGKMMNIITDNAMDTTYQDNLTHAAERLKQESLIGLIQPMNTISVPRYYMSNFDDAINVIETINSPHLRLLVDVYHLQILAGNLTHKIRSVVPIIGHVQIAQVPDRHEPDSPGEINYRYVLNLFEELGYTGWIGLEYTPKVNTLAGLKWIKEFGYVL